MPVLVIRHSAMLMAVDDDVLQRVRVAYAALATGDVAAFSEVLDDEVHWRAVPRGWFRKQRLY